MLGRFNDVNASVLCLERIEFYLMFIVLHLRSD